MTIVWRSFHEYPVPLICVFSHTRSYTYVTIIFEVLIKSWDDLVTLFLQIPAEAAPATWVAVASLEGSSALFLRVLSRAWNVGGQCDLGMSKGLDNLAIPSVSVRPGGCLLLPCLMCLRLLSDGDSSRSCSHFFVRRMSRLCSWIPTASRLWNFLSQCIAAAASFSRHHSWNCGFVRPWME